MHKKRVHDGIKDSYALMLSKVIKIQETARFHFVNFLWSKIRRTMTRRMPRPKIKIGRVLNSTDVKDMTAHAIPTSANKIKRLPNSGSIPEDS